MDCIPYFPSDDAIISLLPPLSKIDLIFIEFFLIFQLSNVDLNTKRACTHASTYTNEY